MRPRAPGPRLATSVALAACVALSTTPAWAVGPSGEWSSVPAPPLPDVTPIPSNRMHHSAIYDPDGARMVVFGGHPTVLNDVWALALTGPSIWTEITPAGTPPSPRWGHAAVYDPVRKRMLVMGGYDNITNINDVYALTLTGTPTWTQILPSGGPPAGRRDHLMIYDPVRDRLVIFGGYTGAFTNDVWALNLSGPPAWTQLTPTGTPPTVRSLVGGIYDPVGDRIVAHGGWNGSYLGDLWSLSLAGTPAWAPLASSGTPPGARRDHAAVYDPVTTRVVYFGGFNGAYLGDVWSLSLAGSPTWSQVLPPSAGPSARNSHTAVLDVAAHRMVVFGGYDDNYKSDSWGLSLSAGSEDWSLFTVVPPPPGPPWPGVNADYAAVYDESRNRVVHLDGKMGGPARYGWSLSLAGVPSWTPLGGDDPTPRRNAHSAILDVANDRALVFGGYDTNYKNDVWSLDLAGSLPMAQLFPGGTPPSIRMYHTAVTDPLRQRMVVFGGHPTVLNDVHVLPFTGPMDWAPLTPAGTPPVPRWGHVAVFDLLRDRMLTFGGVDALDFNRNDLWALNFSPSLEWVPITPIGTPPPGRRGHTMVYDSARDRMILFGGYNSPFPSDTFLNDVWELSLNGTPKWTQLTPTGGPPAPRNQITATYDPLTDRVVVFGGWDGTNFRRDLWILDFFDQPTAVLVSLVRAEAGDAGVELIWQIGEGSDPAQAIERSTDGTSWSQVADASPDADRRVAWTDGDAPAGLRVGYRLRFAGSDGPSTGGEVWVDTPARATLAIQAVLPNPAGERAVVRLTLPGSRRVTLDVVDVAGRRVLSRDLSALAPGRHELPLDGMGSWPAGLYLVRVNSGDRLATARLMVVR